MKLLIFSIICWVCAMVSALFGFALITGGTAVIAQMFFWVFFGLFLASFVVGYAYRGLLPGDSRRY